MQRLPSVNVAHVCTVLATNQSERVTAPGEINFWSGQLHTRRTSSGRLATSSDSNITWLEAEFLTSLNGDRVYSEERDRAMSTYSRSGQNCQYLAPDALSGEGTTLHLSN